MAYGLGVDLGTTYTAAAVVREGHVEMAPLGDRSTAMPSVILMRAEGGVLTGDAANRRAATEPDRVAREVKRRLGDPMPVLLGGTPYSAGDLMAAQLREVVAQISEREGGPPVAVRLTHPANWGPYKRELFEQVPRTAGLSDVTMITEPEAAAAHYAANERIADGTTVAVYDLGGGTFDATVLRTTGGGFEILGAPEGVEGLGGVDFDEAVFGHVDRSLDGAVSALDLSDPAATSAIVRLRQDCVLAKEALSSDTEATIPVLLPSLQTEVRLTRGEFETMIRPSVTSTIASLQRALESADISAEQVDTVLLVGGSSRIPLVSQMVSGELGRPTSVDAHPKHAIVLGAASLAEPPARAAGPGAPGPAHTSVFPTSGAPFRTPVPRVGPRTPPGGIPAGGSGRAASTPAAAAHSGGSGTNSGMIPIVAGPRPSSTGGFSTVSPTGTHGRPLGGRQGTGAFRAGGAGTGATNAGTGSGPTAATRTGGTHTGPTVLRPTYTGPTRTVPARPGPSTGATAAVHSQGPPTQGGQGGQGGTGGRGAPPPSLGGRSGDDEPSAGGSRRRIPLIVGAVVLVAALAGGGTFAYRSLSADTSLPPPPVPSEVVAPTPLPTSAPPEPVDEPATGGSGGSSGSSGSGSAGGSGSGSGSSGSGSGSRDGSGGSGGGRGSTTWAPTTTWDNGGGGTSSGGTSSGGTDTGSTDGGGGGACC